MLELNRNLSMELRIKSARQWCNRTVYERLAYGPTIREQFFICFPEFIAMRALIFDDLSVSLDPKTYNFNHAEAEVRYCMQSYVPAIARRLIHVRTTDLHRHANEIGRRMIRKMATIEDAGEVTFDHPASPRSVLRRFTEEVLHSTSSDVS